MKRQASLRSILWKIIPGMLLAAAVCFVPLPASAQRNAGTGRSAAGRTGTPRTSTIPHPVAPVSGSRIGVQSHGFPPLGISRWRIPRSPIYFRSGGYFHGFGGPLLPHCGLHWGWAYPCSVTPLYSYSLGPIYEPITPIYPFAVNPYISSYPDLEAYGAEETLGPELKEILLYLKDGSVYAIAKYSISDGKLQYTTSEGIENTIDLDRVDAQKTVDANAARGVKFSLDPTPPPAPANPAPGVPPSQR
jgi:hypothetical protein